MVIQDDKIGKFYAKWTEACYRAKFPFKTEPD